MGKQAKHVAVLMGGWDSERPVSLNSGGQCAAALERAGYRVTAVDVDRSITETLKTLEPDVAFNALHGPWGEGGAVQGILETLRIPYTHSGVLASALAMNKEKARLVYKASGLPIAEGRVFDRMEIARRHVMPPPYVVKPIAEGSSFGVIIVREGRTHPPQEVGAADWAYGDRLLVERYVPGRELTCAVMGDVALGVIEIVTDSQPFYDYDAKYAPGGSRHILPAQISPNIYQTIQKLALEAHAVLGCRGVSRSDFRFDERPTGGGDLVILETNTQPGMTPTSLVPEMAAHAGHSFEDLVAWMVEDASCDR